MPLNFILSSCSPFNQGKCKQRVQTVTDPLTLYLKVKRRGQILKFFHTKRNTERTLKANGIALGNNS